MSAKGAKLSALNVTDSLILCKECMSYSDCSCSSSTSSSSSSTCSTCSTCSSSSSCQEEGLNNSIYERNKIYPEHPEVSDKYEVEKLPRCMEAVSIPTKSLEEFIQMRTHKYKNLVKEEFSEKAKINKMINTWLSLTCDEAKQQLEDIDALIQQQKTEFMLTELGQYKPTMEKDFTRAWKEVTELTEQKKAIILKLHERLMDIEKERSDRIGPIFEKYRYRQRNLACQLFDHLEKKYNMRIMRYNQAILSNHHCYMDLRLKLMLEAEESQFSFHQLLLNYNIDLQLQNNIKHYTREEAQRVLEKKEEEEGEKHDSHTPVLTNDMEIAATMIDRSTKLLQNLYKAITYQCYPELVPDLEKYLGLHELEIIGQEIFQPIDVALTKCSFSAPGQKHELVEEMEEMQTTLRDKFSMLKACMLLWDRHLGRIREARSLVSFGIDKMTMQSIKDVDCHETKLSLALDALRQESSEPRLAKALATVHALLDEEKQVHHKNHTREVDSIKLYFELMDTEAGVMKAEILQFLDKNSKDITMKNHSQLPVIYPPNYSVCDVKNLLAIDSSPEPDQPTVPKIFRASRIQVESLQNYGIGLKIGLMSQTELCKEKLRNHAEEWVKKHLEEAQYRLETKLELHEPRYQRTRLEVHDVRQAELRAHEERFDRHNQGVLEQLSAMEGELDELVGSLKKMIRTLETLLVEAEDEANAAMTSLNVSQLITKVEAMVSRLSEELTGSLSRFQEEAAQKISWLRSSNINFIKSIKLFSEDGNFSAEEAQSLTSKLEHLNKPIDHQERYITSEINDLEVSMTRFIQGKTEKTRDMLKSVVEDLQFGEAAVEGITKVQGHIKTETAQMKYNLKVLARKTEQLLAALSEPNRVDLCVMLRERWEPLLAAVGRQHNYLLQPEAETSPDAEEQAKPKQHPPGLRFQQFDRQRPSMVKISRSNKHFADYREGLFNSQDPPLVGDGFLPRVCMHLWDAFGELQNLASDFYSSKGNRPVSKPDIIQPMFDNFVEELLVKFKYYHVQCEEVWLDEVHEFLVLVQKLRTTANSYAELGLLQFHTCHQRALSETHALFAKDFMSLKKRDIKQRRDLSERLKPVLGLYSNRKLLEALNQEVEECYVLHESKGSNYVAQYKRFLERKLEEYRSEGEVQGDPIRSLQDQLFRTEDLTKDLACKVEDILKGIQNDIQEKTPVPSVQELRGHKKPTRTNSMLSRRIRLKLNAHGGKDVGTKQASLTQVPNRGNIPRQHRLSIDHDNFYMKSIRTCINTLRRETFVMAGQVESEIYNSPIPEQPLITSVVDVHPPSVSPFNVAETLNAMREEFHKQIEDCSRQAEELLVSYKTANQTWFNVWKVQLEKIKEFYNMYYGIGPIIRT